MVPTRIYPMKMHSSNLTICFHAERNEVESRAVLIRDDCLFFQITKPIFNKYLST